MAFDRDQGFGDDAMCENYFILCRYYCGNKKQSCVVRVRTSRPPRPGNVRPVVVRNRIQPPTDFVTPSNSFSSFDHSVEHTRQCSRTVRISRFPDIIYPLHAPTVPSVTVRTGRVAYERENGSIQHIFFVYSKDICKLTKKLRLNILTFRYIFLTF